MKGKQTGVRMTKSALKAQRDSERWSDREPTPRERRRRAEREERKVVYLVYPVTICEGETPDDCDASSSDGRCDTCGKAKP